MFTNSHTYNLYLSPHFNLYFEGGMEVIDEFYSEYRGKPNQSKIRSEGEAYLSKKYPLLSYFVSAEFVDDLFAL